MFQIRNDAKIRSNKLRQDYTTIDRYCGVATAHENNITSWDVTQQTASKSNSVKVS